MQVVAELSRSGSQGRSKQPGGRRYSIYSKARHNIRTCQEGIKASGDKYSN